MHTITGHAHAESQSLGNCAANMSDMCVCLHARATSQPVAHRSQHSKGMCRCGCARDIAGSTMQCQHHLLLVGCSIDYAATALCMHAGTFWLCSPCRCCVQALHQITHDASTELEDAATSSTASTSSLSRRVGTKVGSEV